MTTMDGGNATGLQEQPLPMQALIAALISK
jgi:hypothetical protein